MTAGTDRVTTNGQTLTRRMLAYLDASYTAAGMDPATYRVVTQGSYKAGGGASASGSTHDAAGAADLRVWNLPRGMSGFSVGHPLVVELRRRGGAAWFRDAAHGGMDPHIHVILGPVGSEPGLSSGAASQVRDYQAGKNGLSSKGSDYHTRPTQTVFVYPGDTPTHRPKDPDTMLIQSHTGSWWLLNGGHLCSLNGGTAGNARAAGIPAWKVDSAAMWDILLAAYPVRD